MKEYKNPTLEIILFNTNDVIVTSGEPTSVESDQEIKLPEINMFPSNPA